MIRTQIRTQASTYSAKLARLGLLMALAATLQACSKQEPAPEPIRAVRVLTVGLASMQAGIEYVAEVRPRVESNLGFRVAGKITKRQVEAGQRVKAGQMLAQVDPQDYKLAADAARAQVSAAQSNFDLASADYKRYKALKEQNFIGGAELDRRESALKAAQAQLEQAQAQLSAQGNQAAYANLLADVSGVVTAVLAEPGQVVAAGTPVVRIAQDGPRDAVFAVPEDKVAAVRVGSEVRIKRWAPRLDTSGDMNGNASGQLGGELKGRVREVAAVADPATRTYNVKVTLEGQGVPALGSTLYVEPLALGHVGAVVIKLPTSALKQDGQSSAVWVLDKASMTVRSQPIQIATADGNDAIIAAGLQPGDVVVSAGVHVLSPGQKVSIYEEKMAESLANNASTAIKNVANNAANNAANKAAGNGPSSTSAPSPAPAAPAPSAAK